MNLFSSIVRYKAGIAAAILFALGVGLLGNTLLSWFAPPGQLAQVENVAPDEGFIDGFDVDLSPASGALSDVTDSDAEQASVFVPDEVIAYISGAVRAPDVYLLPDGARVKDLVLAAGGLSADADIERINLAAPVADGEHVIIPWIGMISQAVETDAAAAEVGVSGMSGGLLDINRASAAELDELPGIGPTLAERIVAWRESEGPFQSVDDLGNVDGVGPAVLAKIAPLVVVGQ